MPLPKRRQLKYIATLCIGLLVMGFQPARAADTGSSLFNNPAAVSLVSLMFVLLIVIGFLGNILLGAAAIKRKKDKQKNQPPKATILPLLLLLLFSNALFAQTAEAGAAPVQAVSSGIAGMPAFTFYTIIAVIFLELLVILVLLGNIRVLLRTEKEIEPTTAPEPAAIKKQAIRWWIRLNSFKPVEQEADIDLGHDYDGIRELDNRLPPWWLYGFYITIITAGIYLWRFEVSHTGPSSIEEYNKSIADADLEIKTYLAKKGDAVDENTVTLLTSPDDIAAGKTIFLSSCTACHKETGAGDVGPNLTDDYWLHGGDIKSVFKTIRYGVNAMPQWQNNYSNKQIAQIASYVKSLKGSNPPNPKAPQGELYKDDNSPVTTHPDSTIATETKIATN